MCREIFDDGSSPWQRTSEGKIKRCHTRHGRPISKTYVMTLYKGLSDQFIKPSIPSGDDTGNRKKGRHPLDGRAQYLTKFAAEDATRPIPGNL